MIGSKKKIEKLLQKIKRFPTEFIRYSFPIKEDRILIKKE